MDSRDRLIVTASLAVGAAGALWFWQRRNDKKHAIPANIATSPYSKQVKLAVRLALQAGRNMYRYCDETGTQAAEQHDLGISEKSKPEDFFTKIDVENERIVMDGIQKYFPKDKIIGEESVGTGGIPPLTDDPTWIIDPIDGTTNFASGLPLTCVSIGYCVKGEPIMGVVYAPMTDELFAGVKGYGCFRNGVRISQRHHKELINAIVCFEFGYSRKPEQVATMVGAVERILNHGCRSTRHLGSGVLDLCYVATGRLDAVYAGLAGEGWKPWDFCAGLVIVQEAGCVMEAIDQKEAGPFDIYSKSHICAVSKKLMEHLRQLVQPK